MKLRSVGALVVSASLSLIAIGVIPSGSASAGSLTKVSFAYDFPGPDFELTPFVVAQDQGFFKAAGLDVKVTFPPNTATTTQMLTTNAADVGLITTTDMGVGVAAGAPPYSRLPTTR